MKCENKSIDKVIIEFGPYPLKKDWLVKKNKKNNLNKKSLGRGRSESRKMFLPPDEESDPNYGSRCLVIEYGSAELSHDKSEHLESKLCKKLNLEQPIKRFVDKFNENVSFFKRT